MTWVDLSSAFAYGSKLTSTQMQNLRDNVSHLRADGRNYVTLTESQSDEKTTTDAAYDELTAYRFHVPESAEVLKIWLDLKTSDSLETAGVKAEVTDDEAATADDEETHTGNTNFSAKLLEIDCSSLSDGPGTLKIYGKCSGGATCTVAGISIYWSTS